MKIGFLITARLKSSRLRLKLLRDLQGKTIIQRVIDRVRKIQNIDEIVLCTSKNPQDKALVETARMNNIYYFNGDGEDVMLRLTEAAKFYGFEYIVGITGENPLFSIDHANQIVDLIQSERKDFIYFDGLPLGCATFGMKVKAMETICAVKNVVNTEMWGYLIKQPEIFDILEVKVDDYYRDPDLRITTDHLEDYQFISALYEELAEDKLYSHHNLVKLLKEKPELREIHAHKTQDRMPQSKIDEINKYFNNNKEEIIKVKNGIYNS